MNLRTWRTIALIGVAFEIVGSVIDMVVNTAQSLAFTTMQSDLNSTGSVSDATMLLASKADDLAITFGVAGVVSFIVSLVAVIGWGYALVKTAYLRNPHSVSSTPGWAIGSWFIPFYNLVAPRRLISEALKELRTKPALGLLMTWWIMNWVVNLWAVSTSRLVSDALIQFDTATDLESWNSAADATLEAYSASTAGDLLGIVSAIVFLVLVLKSYPIDRISKQDSVETQESVSI